MDLRIATSAPAGRRAARDGEHEGFSKIPELRVLPY
jgi:hypothetical protein